MCRIAGLITNKLEQRSIKAAVTAMCDTMQHGGPDDDGIFEDVAENLVFGHRRLSIIELNQNGHQPMADNNAQVWITFNGEIFNYQELRRELEQLGAKFATQTDTEVIINAYLYWQTKSFSKLKGMFAFALYDTRKAQTYLVRDSGGVKPLYYFVEPGQLAFASEIKAFKASGIATQPDIEWPVRLLAYGHIPEPYTTLKNVRSLPKGHYLIREQNGATALKSYIANENGAAIISTKEAQEGVFSLLNSAVKHQLISDAPIGVFLSGGIDSSILTLLASLEPAHRLKTVSIYFNEKQYDERNYQDALLSIVGGENHKHLVTEADFNRYFATILTAMDMPTTDGINSWFISKYAHDTGLKAVLSGTGADELFGGYPSFERIGLIKYLRTIPSSLLKKSNLIKFRNYKRLSYLAYHHSAADYLFLRGLYTVRDISRAIDIDEAQVADILFRDNSYPHFGRYDKLHAAWFETNMYMQNQLLRDTDVMSMCHGLEVRVPFLDENLRAFITRIDPAILFGNERPKQLLIDSFKELLPPCIWNRPKMGFTFPLQKWMKDNHNVADPGFYNTKFAKEIINKFQTGKTHWSQAFALYQVQAHV
jgi:asparagine synthase (glutamine-hydrolysing)